MYERGSSCPDSVMYCDCDCSWIDSGICGLVGGGWGTNVVGRHEVLLWARARSQPEFVKTTLFLNRGSGSRTENSNSGAKYEVPCSWDRNTTLDPSLPFQYHDAVDVQKFFCYIYA